MRKPQPAVWKNRCGETRTDASKIKEIWGQGMNDFEGHVYMMLLEEASSWQIPAQDIYALSLGVRNEEDDPKRPRFLFSHNPPPPPPSPASRLQELRAKFRPQPAERKNWNPAAWILSSGNVIGSSYDDDPKQREAIRLRELWLRSLDLWYEEESTDRQTQRQLDVQITRAAFQLCIRLVRRLHSDGVVQKIAGPNVPVLIHDLDCGIEWLDLAAEANPLHTIQEFKEWIFEWNNIPRY